MKIQFFLIPLLSLALLPVSKAGPVFVSESKDNKIATFLLDPESGALTRSSEVDAGGAPGCLALSRDKTKLYASIRTTESFATFGIGDAGKLKLISTAPGPGSAAYIYTDKTNRWLLSACYGNGKVAVSAIKDQIVTGPPVQVLEMGKKAHCIQTSPSNLFAFVPHTGELNRVDQFRFDPEKGRLAKNSFASGVEGGGPRHLQFHPNGKWVYLVNEQGKSVTHCKFDSESGKLALQGTVSTLPDDHSEKGGSCADIEISADGKFVYASNRGHNSIAIFKIDPQSGAVRSLGQEPTEEIPRSFNLIGKDEKFLVAAGQKSNTLAVYRRDSETGLLKKLGVIPCGNSPAWVQGW